VNARHQKRKTKGENNMPMGKGTYGKQVGRPPKKKMGPMGKAKAKMKPKNGKPMSTVKNGNGTNGKLTAAQKTLPDFLQKKIKASKSKKKA
jgi:hypothetical protein